MAAIAEETEQERLAREEQEAAQAEMERLLATRIEPPDSQLPQEAIPAENVSFTNGADGQIQIDTPEGFAPTFNRQMVGDTQYQNELARAQRGNGFLNADIGPAGNTIVGGYDPAVAEAAQMRQQEKLATQAERFAGAQGYQACIKNGGTPAECSTMWGPKMWKGDAAGYVNFATRREPLPRVTKAAPLQKFQGGSIPPDIALRQKQLAGEVTRDRMLLDRGTERVMDEKTKKMVTVPLDSRKKLALSRGIEYMQKQGMELIAPGGRLNPAYNKAVDVTGWRNMQDEWERPSVQAAPTKQAAAPAKGDEEVVVVKDGRRYSVPKSQLDEAIKAGYKAQ